MLLNFTLFFFFFFFQFPEASKNSTLLNSFVWFFPWIALFPAWSDFENIFALKTNQKCVGDHCWLPESKAHMLVHCCQEFSQGVLSLASLRWVPGGDAFKSGFHGGLVALINLKSCIILWHCCTHYPIAGKGVLLRKDKSCVCAAAAWINSTVAEAQVWPSSQSQSLVIYFAVVVQAQFFLLSFCKDFSATLCLSNIAIKQYPIVAIFIGNCVVLFSFVF